MTDHTATAVAPDEAAVPVRQRGGATGLVARGRRRWLRVPSRHLVLAGLGVWAASRVAFALAVQCGLFVNRPGSAAGRPGFLASMHRWDALWYLDLAQHGYFYPPDQHDRLGYGQGTAAFFPLPPILIRAVAVVTDSYSVAGLVVSAVASAVAFVALTRLVAFELEYLGEELRDRGARIAPRLLAFSPYAIFLFLPYSEPVFLAFAIPGWLAARQNRWRTAGILIAAASATKVNGLFVLAGVLVLYAFQRRQAGLAVIRPPALWFFAPLASVGTYVLYLHSRTGDWDAWQHAQERSWHRIPRGLVASWTITWHAAFAPRGRTDYLWARRAELLVALLGLALIVVLLLMRRWAEGLYVALSWFALATNGLYLSFPRSTLLWWPGFVLLARLSASRPWIGQAILAITTPLAFVLGAAWAASGWVN